MAWAKSLRTILGGTDHYSRPEFFEEKQLSLVEASTLSAIRNETDKTQQNKLLIKKLKLCCNICDFRLAQEGGDINEKKRIFNKTSMLHEIFTYLQLGTNWNTLEVITQIFETVSCNLFRPQPDSYLTQHLMGVDHIVPITYTIPSWQHLEIIYSIIELTFSNTEINQLLVTEYIKKYNFIKNFVYSLNTVDKNERNHIQSVLETFYDEHGDLFETELILHLANYCLDFIYYEIGSAEGIKSVLNIFNSMSLIDAQIYVKILIPLHKMQYKYFRRYEFVLWIYCKRIIEEDESLSLLLFKNIIQFWPKTNGFKEQQFLKKIAIILEFVEEDIWKNVDRYSQPKQFKLFQVVAGKILHCLQNANHYKTICDVLDLIEQEEVQEFIDIYGGQELWCKIYQSLYDIVTYFFFFETVQKTKETMHILKEDEVPMRYMRTFQDIESGKIRMYPLSITTFKGKDNKSQIVIIDKKQQKRQKRYDKLRKKAHSTPLYKRVKKQKEREQKQERILQEKKEKERKRKELLKKQQKRRPKRPEKQKQVKVFSTPQLHSAPPPPPQHSHGRRQHPASPSDKLMSELTRKLSVTNDDNDIPKMSLYHSEPMQYNIIPKKKQKRVQNLKSAKPKSDKSGRTSVPKSFFKRSQSTGNVLADNSFLASLSPKLGKKFKFGLPTSPKNRVLPHLPKIKKSNSSQNVEKLRLKQEKQKQKEEKQRLKAEKKKQKDLEKERKNEEKRVKKELKKREKDMRNKGNKNRIRKSVDIDRRSSSISNPVPPAINSDAFDKYKQIMLNNEINHYLNTQYYASTNYVVTNTNTNTNGSEYKSPALAFSYSPSAKYDPPTIALTDTESNNSYKKHRKVANKAKSGNFNRAGTPPPPPAKKSSASNNNNQSQGFSFSLAKPKPLDMSHPLHKNNKNKNKKIESGKSKIRPQSARSRRAPPRPWPPVSKAT